MIYCISMDAHAYLEEQHIEHFFASDDINLDLSAFSERPQTLSIIADSHQITDCLHYRSVCLSRRLGIQIGFIPFHPSFKGAVNRLLQPLPETSNDYVGAYDSEYPDTSYGRSERKLLSTTQRVQLIGNNTPDSAVLEKSWLALCVSTSGRQTFIQFGDRGCLHPGMENPPQGVLTPTDIRCDHWMLQSCHSPFVWTQYGSYLSFPLALILRGNARSVICSTKLQTFTPGILLLYVSLLRFGYSTGDICEALNRYSELMNIDDTPFMLLGRPDLLPVIGASRFESHYANKGLSEKIPSCTMRMVQLRNNINNIKFLLDRHTFYFNDRIDSDSGKLEEVREIFLQASRTYSENLPLFRWQVTAGKMEQSLVEMYDDIRNRIIDDIWAQLRRLPNLLRKVWVPKTGYFYYFGPTLERSYRFTYSKTDIENGESKTRKKLQYIGEGAAQDYEWRHQTVSARGLVTKDCSDRYVDFIALNVNKCGNEWQISLSFKNLSGEPKYLFAFVKLTDPNNVSVNTGERVYRELLNEVTLEYPNGNWEAVTVSDGGEVSYSAKFSIMAPRLFYLLIEAHVFVDFCWNWVSETLAFPCIDDWLNSEQYRRAIPQREN